MANCNSNHHTLKNALNGTVMNLKKCLFSAALVLLFSTVFAQPVGGDDDNGSKFYVKVYGGYGLVNPGSFKLISYTTSSGPQTFNTSKNGLGAGVRFGGGIGVIASDFLNVGVDVDYLSGSTINSKSHTVDNDTPPTDFTTLERLNYNALAIIPNIVFKAISKPDYLIYTKVGALLNLPTNISKSEIDSLVPEGTANNYKQVFNGKYKIGLTAGLNVALGVQYRLTDNLRAFGEVFGDFISLVPKQYDEVAVTTGSTPKTITTHITYQDNGQTNYSSNPDGTVVSSTSPQEGNRFNMNTIGINIGITYRF